MHTLDAEGKRLSGDLLDDAARLALRYLPAGTVLIVEGARESIALVAAIAAEAPLDEGAFAPVYGRLLVVTDRLGAGELDVVGLAKFNHNGTPRAEPVVRLVNFTTSAAPAKARAKKAPARQKSAATKARQKKSAK